MGRWYETSAEIDKTTADRNLELMFPNGIGVRQDHAEALRWSLAAAEQGHVEAQARVAPRARRRRAAELGDGRNLFPPGGAPELHAGDGAIGAHVQPRPGHRAKRVGGGAVVPRGGGSG